MNRLEVAIRKAISDAEETGKLGFRIGRRFEEVPMGTFREVCYIAKALRANKREGTINFQAKDICEHFGVRFAERGTGWTVVRNEQSWAQQKKKGNQGMLNQRRGMGQRMSQRDSKRL